MKPKKQIPRWFQIRDEFERNYLRQLVNATFGDMIEAAALADLSRHTLNKIIIRLGMREEVAKIRLATRQQRLAKKKQNRESLSLSSPYEDSTPFKEQNNDDEIDEDLSDALDATIEDDEENEDSLDG